MPIDNKKRQLLKTISALGITASIAPLNCLAALPHSDQLGIIPSSGESVFPIGMGTWITFNVGRDLQLRQQRAQVLHTFFEQGGQMVDSSPMYGSSEEVLGYCFQQVANEHKLFSATKTWTSSAEEGIEQFADSQQLWQQASFDLLQVHNLVGWQYHLPMLRELKQQKLIRYIGVTTSHGRRHSELIKVINSQAIDFIQLTYNAADRDAEHKILSLARDKGIAVIANRPLDGGRLMNSFERQPLPPWSGEIGCNNWAQFFLRFIISHPAITTAIPATSKVEHMIENMGTVNQVPLPDMRQREKMMNYLKAL